MTLQLGKFYKARNGVIWCCFRLRWARETQALCVDPQGWIAYFALDGRCDPSKDRTAEHDLIAEAEPPPIN